MEEDLPTPPPDSEHSTPSDELWLVSYGDTDDREMTSGQIFRALERQEISRSTIVWKDGMDEWLPIDQVQAFEVAPLAAPRPTKQKTVLGGFQAVPRRQLQTPVKAETPENPGRDVPNRLTEPMFLAPPQPRSGPLEDLDSGLLESLVDFEPMAPDDEAVTRQLPAVMDDEMPPSSLRTMVDSLPSDALDSLPPDALDSATSSVPASELPTAMGHAPPPDIFELELATVDANEVPGPQTPRSEAPRVTESLPAPRREPLLAPPTILVESEVLGHGEDTQFPAKRQSRAWLILLLLFAALAAVAAAFWLGQQSVQGTTGSTAPSSDLVAPPAASVAPEPEPPAEAAPEDNGPDAEAPEDAEDEPPAAQRRVVRRTQPAPAAPTPPAKSAAAEPAEPAKPLQPFDQNAAAAALTRAAANASSCRKENDPSGMANVSVTFSSSGRAVRATVSGPPFSGTSTGGCIASTMRGAKVPAFEGDRVTVKKRVVIQ